MVGAHARGGLSGTRFADVRRHAEVGSTNDVAAALARQGAPEGLVVVADHQTAGRGRWGRSWEDLPGSSLLVSVVLRPGPGQGPPTLVTAACGLAAADACLDVAGLWPGLKWPNDLVVGDRKLAGILAEVVPVPDGAPPAVVVGLGLNLVRPASSGSAFLASNAIAAEEVAGRPVDRDAVLEAFLVRLEHRCTALADPAGREWLLDEYRERCVTLGREVRVELPGGSTVEGQAVGVGPDGSLAVRTEDDQVTLMAAGDVVHLR